MGKAGGVEFKAFVDNMGELPDIDAILQGTSLQVPRGIDLQYGIAAALVRRAVQVREMPHANLVYGRIPQVREELSATRDGGDAGHRHAPLDRQAAHQRARICRMGGKHNGSHAVRLETRGGHLSALQTKLGAARARLILEQPFIGALVLHLPLVPADPAWCTTMATDARAFYFNPHYIAGLTLAQTQFVLAHEAMHCALGHFARRGHRTRRRWDVACDHAANLLLVDEGFKPPPGALANADFRGLSAEEIYPLVPPDTPERTLDRHLFDDIAPETPLRHGICATRSRAHVEAEPPGGRSTMNQRRPGSWDDAGDESRSAGAACRGVRAC